MPADGRRCLIMSETTTLSPADVFPAATGTRFGDGRVQCDLGRAFASCGTASAASASCGLATMADGVDPYGRSSGFCIDPIEKKPLNHFLPGTPILSFGTAGCNLTASSVRTGTSASRASSTSFPTRRVPRRSPRRRRARLPQRCFTYNDR
jgi:pyruvate formate lyase activating enzyme